MQTRQSAQSVRLTIGSDFTLSMLLMVAENGAVVACMPVDGSAGGASGARCVRWDHASVGAGPDAREHPAARQIDTSLSNNCEM